MSEQAKASPARRSHLIVQRLLLIGSAITILALAGLVFTRNLIDFPVYYAAGQSLLSGRSDLYAADFARGPVMDYRYPPFFLLVFAPLWLLPYPVAAYVWYSLGVLQIYLCVLVLHTAMKEIDPAASVSRVWLLAFFAVAQYFVMILHYGNAQLLAISLMFGSLYLAMRRRDLKAALLMSLALSIKLTPLLFLPYFALKRRWRLLLRVCGFVVAMNLAPAAYFGFGRNLTLLETWYRHVVVSQEFHEANGPINLSLKGQLRRYLTEVDYNQRIDGDTEYPPVNVARLPRTAVDALWLDLSGALVACALGLIWWLSHRLNHADGADRKECETLEYGLMVCLMLIVGPLSSKIYFIALLWPVVSLAFLAPQKSISGRLLPFIAALNLVLPLLPGRSTQRLLLVLGVDLHLTCLLLILSARELLRSWREHPARFAGLRTQSRPAAKTP